MTSRPDRVQEAADRFLEGQPFHLIGIGGAGMSVVAQLLAARGARVSGSDAGGGPAFERLAAQGMEVHLGHDAAQVPRQARVVVSTAIKETNPELAIARQRGQEVIHRSQALALAAQGLDFVAVAGAHGKTTTSGMLAEALTAAGTDPSFAIGGTVRALGTGAHLGTGRALVAEADESDRSFLNYAPRIAIVTNVEPDHLDNYADAQDFEQAFADFASRITPGGLLIACAQDPGSLRLAQRACEQGTRVITFSQEGPSGLPGGELLGEGHVHLDITERSASATRARITLSGPGPGGQPAVMHRADLVLGVPGDHVALDAAGAWAAGIELGVGPKDMARALGAFGGTGRRFEERGRAAGVRVIDDYAHHPTEIDALLAAARQSAAESQGRVLVVFQPHLFSRTRQFAERFAQALSAADEVVVTDVYPARESQEDFPGITGATIAERITAVPARFIPDRHQAALQAAAAARPGDLVLTVGAGDVTELGATILQELGADREPASGSMTGTGRRPW
ncbi:UDP-N-acetylmuramate--L-alanine ligase [Actinomyces slackii]|uniref:UDP-N-acetylmuramate--L-alanine ligase n=1 Tax=Actinomyces slackii TaxID=52774 RepID=A0A448KF48_9ACTO|nr:UDP-N-acetylmuramate--L-alanine ligase [Actinomyces slackii]VEG75532.1 UDP-N-acetylmuramate--L-alanine ligase [Actinomyces slackii]